MNKPHVDHVGIVVDDLEQAIAAFERLLGTPPSAVKELTDAGLRVAEFEVANLTIELLAYTGAGDGFAKSVMGARAGLNHVTLRVADVEAAVADFAAAGIRVMAGFPRPGAHGRIAFFEPETTAGALIEVCAPD